MNNNTTPLHNTKQVLKQQTDELQGLLDDRDYPLNYNTDDEA